MSEVDWNFQLAEQLGNREVLHDGAEIALLRDLYLWRFGEPGSGRLCPGPTWHHGRVRPTAPGA